MLVVMEENGFPVELESVRAIERAIASGRLRPATIVRAGDDADSLHLSRAEEVPFLRPLFGLKDEPAPKPEAIPVPAPPASLPVTSSPSPSMTTAKRAAALWSPSGPAPVVPPVAASPIQTIDVDDPVPADRPPPPARRSRPASYTQPAGGLACAFMPLARYAQFAGRSSRTEFWGFALLQIVVLFIATGVLASSLLFNLLVLALIVPGLAVAVRRLHDHNLSGFYVLLGLIPYVGWVIVMILMLVAGDRGANRFGPNPRP